ncbi:MAG: transcriptional regulator [Candidatus Pacebacteria bacterium CG_4_10_14_3_um_filter_34_15]|nr:MAG: transcriptional regulator [Candidatus Pacebacteria bacterium CG_4_10_14_3_um_filter_34_15]PJC43459.1 MAG: transcriptional regulator [Candidatus Pacebacteria bacterium CG_4_9_14_0_2_um_filter_34_50]
MFMKNNDIKDLIAVMLQVQNQEDMLDLLKGLLTVGELEEIARRLQIVKLLKAGMSQRDIAEKLKVGITTVTRGSKELKQGRFLKI